MTYVNWMRIPGGALRHRAQPASYPGGVGLVKASGRYTPEEVVAKLNYSPRAVLRNSRERFVCQDRKQINRRLNAAVISVVSAKMIPNETDQANPKKNSKAYKEIHPPAAAASSKRQLHVHNRGMMITIAMSRAKVSVQLIWQQLLHRSKVWLGYNWGYRVSASGYGPPLQV